MKNIIILSILIVFTFSFEVFSQTSYFGAPPERLSITTDPKNPVNNEFPKKINRFDWTQDSFSLKSSNFYKFNKIVSPFYQTDNPQIIEIMHEIDMLPEDGWELLCYDSGISQTDTNARYSSDYPFIVLYNKYRGIIRVFIILKMKSNPNDGYTTLLTLRGYDWDGYKENQRIILPYSSILGNYKPYNSLDNYSEYTTIYYRPFNTDYAAWNWGDIDVIYDPCVCKTHQLLYFSIGLFRYNEIEIEGKKAIISNVYSFQSLFLAAPGDRLFQTNYLYPEVKEFYYPYYNNILGTFNLLRTPEINYSTNHKTDYKYQFKLSKEIDYVINPAAGFHLDSLDIKARYVVEFSDNPGIPSTDNFYRVNDKRYESMDVPIGCLTDYTLKFSTPFKETPTRVYMKLSGDFKKINKKGSTPNQYLEMPFKVNLSKKDDIDFGDDYWYNNFVLECKKDILPYNLDYKKIEEFCSKNEYITELDFEYPHYRNIRKISDTVEFTSKPMRQTRLYDLYPNPAKDFINIEFALNTEKEVNIYIVDMLGRRVNDASIKQQLSRGRYVFELDISYISQGMYMIILDDGKSKDYKKLVISR